VEVVTAEEIAFRYSAGFDVIDGLSFSVGEGALLRLSGPNGSGKTTLIKLLARFHEPVGGSLDLPAAHEIGWMPDNPALLDHLTILEHFRFLSAVGVSFDEERALERTGLSDSADLLCGAASFGMRRRVSYAIATALPKRLLLLDEPFNGIDSGFVASMQSEIRLMLEDGAAVVVATHGASTVEGVDHQELILGGGSGTGGEV